MMLRGAECRQVPNPTCVDCCHDLDVSGHKGKLQVLSWLLCCFDHSLPQSLSIACRSLDFKAAYLSFIVTAMKYSILSTALFFSFTLAQFPSVGVTIETIYSCPESATEYLTLTVALVANSTATEVVPAPTPSTEVAFQPYAITTTNVVFQTVVQTVCHGTLFFGPSTEDLRFTPPYTMSRRSPLLRPCRRLQPQQLRLSTQ